LMQCRCCTTTQLDTHFAHSRAELLIENWVAQRVLPKQYAADNLLHCNTPTWLKQVCLCLVLCLYVVDAPVEPQHHRLTLRTHGLHACSGNLLWKEQHNKEKLPNSSLTALN
jgi:hypothetical protein